MLFLRVLDITRPVGKPLLEWDEVLEQAEDKNVKLDGTVKAFLLLKTCNLQFSDLKMVFRELDTAKDSDGNLPYDSLTQVKDALTKFEATGQLNSLCKKQK